MSHRATGHGIYEAGTTTTWTVVQVADLRLWAMSTEEDRIEAFLVRSGLVAQSVDVLRPDYPRWIRHLRSKGVTHI